MGTLLSIFYDSRASLPKEGIYNSCRLNESKQHSLKGHSMSMILNFSLLQEKEK